MTLKREIALATLRLRLAVKLLAASLVTILGGMAITWLVKQARIVEQEPPIAIPIPVVTDPTGPTAAQVQEIMDELASLRAEREAERMAPPPIAVPPKRKPKAKPP